MLSMLAVAAFVAFGVQASHVKAEGPTHEGTVVSFAGDKLMMTAGGKEHSHTLAKDAKLTIDGKEAKQADFKAGRKIRVTTGKSSDGKPVATMFEGLDKNTDFGK